MKTFVVLRRSVYRAGAERGGGGGGRLAGACYVNRAYWRGILRAETYRLTSVVGVLSSDCDYSIPDFYEADNNRE